MHTIRRQAAIDLRHGAGEGAYITEQQIDNYLIANHEPEEGALAARQKHDATLKTVRESNAKAGIYRDASRSWPKCAPRRNSTTGTSSTAHYRQHLTREELNWQKCAAARHQYSRRNCAHKGQPPFPNASARNNMRCRPPYGSSTTLTIIDTGAQVTTMPESAVNRMPTAHNHRDAPPGTAVKYGNGEIETIERLVDIGHYEVQITPNNCSTSLISVDQIVADGYTVTFSATETIITDDNDRYRLTYPRVPNSREWTVPMQICPGSARTTPFAAIDNHRLPRAGRRHSRRVCS